MTHSRLEVRFHVQCRPLAVRWRESLASRAIGYGGFGCGHECGAIMLCSGSRTANDSANTLIIRGLSSIYNMVLAAPLFLMSQTRSMRGFYLANKQAFINLGMGMTSTYLALSLLSKMSEVEEAKRQLGAVTAQHGAVVARLSSSAYLNTLAETLGWPRPDDKRVELAIALATAEARLAARQERQRLEDARAAIGSSVWSSVAGAFVRKSKIAQQPGESSEVSMLTQSSSTDEPISVPTRGERPATRVPTVEAGTRGTVGAPAGLL